MKPGACFVFEQLKFESIGQTFASVDKQYVHFSVPSHGLQLLERWETK